VERQLLDYFEMSGGACLGKQGSPCGIACRHNLAADNELLSSTFRVTCVLKLARLGPFTLEEIGHILGVTRERVRQIEAKGLEKLARCEERRRREEDA
jgi:hypothetical protein